MGQLDPHYINAELLDAGPHIYDQGCAHQMTLCQSCVLAKASQKEGES